MKEKSNKMATNVILYLWKKNDFDYHFISVHGGQHTCEKCCACFLNHINLINYIALAHEKQHTCEICRAKFVNQIDLENHIESIHNGKKQHNCKKKLSTKNLTWLEDYLKKIL